MALFGSVVGGPLIMETVTGVHTLGHVHTVLARLWARHPEVEGKTRAVVNLAAAEIGANIVEHSGAGAAIRLLMRAEVAGGHVKVVFIDDGPPANVQLGAVTMPHVLAERGRGLAIAREVLHGLSYRREPDGNRWTLLRRLAG